MIDFSTRLTKKTFTFGDMVGVFATFESSIIITQSTGNKNDL